MDPVDRGEWPSAGHSVKPDRRARVVVARMPRWRLTPEESAVALTGTRLARVAQPGKGGLGCSDKRSLVGWNPGTMLQQLRSASSNAKPPRGFCFSVRGFECNERT